MTVPILKQGSYLIASIQSALTDGEVLELRDELADRIGRYRSRGIIIDVAALDVIDSFVARSLRTIARTAALRGAGTVIVGIQPDVAVAMVQFRLNLEPLQTALDLEEALALLDRRKERALAARLGFSRTDATLIATAISEIGRNILVHAGAGEVAIAETAQDDLLGIEVVARDSGPGIPDVEAALSEGYATGNGLGHGHPGAKRLMDEFSIETALGR